MTKSSVSRSREEYGDWQTNYPLALAICQMLKDNGVSPQVVIEPTCGKGNFILAALETFDEIEEVYGIEINDNYLKELQENLPLHNRLQKVHVHLINENFFDVDFNKIIASIHGKNILVLGNPPWVTNSKLGELGSSNLPAKSNFKNNKGLEAITGKGNFDIAEYIVYKMQDVIKGENAQIAVLLKNSVIKNIIYEQGKKQNLADIKQYNIDTEKEFSASVASSLFWAKANEKGNAACSVYDFYSSKYIKSFGWVNAHFVSNIENYRQTSFVDGKSNLTWWSGLKHDCSNILELEYKDGFYYNKLGEKADVEDGIVYPFLKSSDLKGNEISRCRKYVILTQHKTSEDTAELNKTYPKAYRYLEQHVSYFEKRKSTIYKKRPRFCIFGIGDYSFKKYKIAISGLYKQTRFSLVSEIDGKLALLDDTTYLLGFNSQVFAIYTLKLLNSEIVQQFLSSVYFDDAKRPINKDLLMRIDLVAVLNRLGKEYLNIGTEEFERYKAYLHPYSEGNLFDLS